MVAAPRMKWIGASHVGSVVSKHGERRALPAAGLIGIWRFEFYWQGECSLDAVHAHVRNWCTKGIGGGLQVTQRQPARRDRLNPSISLTS
jgi:hypothetical protein